jgi:hypothetical protein
MSKDDDVTEQTAKKLLAAVNRLATAIETWQQAMDAEYGIKHTLRVKEFPSASLEDLKRTAASLDRFIELQREAKAEEEDKKSPH